MLAIWLKSRSWELSPDEGKRLGKAVKNVASHYDVEASKKTMDWANLIVCAGIIYGPRIASTVAEKRGRKPSQNGSQTDNVISPAIWTAPA